MRLHSLVLWANSVLCPAVFGISAACLILAPSLRAAEITLAWDPNSEPDLAGYRLYVGTESGSYGQPINVGNFIEKTLTGLTPGTTYYAVVTAYNTFDLESDYSTELPFTIPLEGGLLDSDDDGLPDDFELAYGNGGDLDPYSDLDGDGLSALGEFVHGLDPTAPLPGSPMTVELIDETGSLYLTVRYLVDVHAPDLVSTTVQRRIGLDSPYGWIDGQMIPVSSGPSTADPDLLEIVERSPEPFGTHPMEFFRFRYEPLSAQ